MIDIPILVRVAIFKNENGNEIYSRLDRIYTLNFMPVDEYEEEKRLEQLAKEQIEKEREEKKKRERNNKWNVMHEISKNTGKDSALL